MPPGVSVARVQRAQQVDQALAGLALFRLIVGAIVETVDRVHGERVLNRTAA